MRKNKLVLSCLAGKREDWDAAPEDTAWREFWEESGKVRASTGKREQVKCVFSRYPPLRRDFWFRLDNTYTEYFTVLWRSEKEPSRLLFCETVVIRSVFLCAPGEC